MSTNAAYSAAEEEESFELNPKPLLIVALSTTVLAFALTWLFPVLVDGAGFVRWLLIVPGLLAAGIAVRIRLRSPLVWALAAVALFCASTAIAVPVTHRGDFDKLKPVQPEDGPLTAKGNKLTVDESEAETKLVLATFEDPTVSGPSPSAAPGGPRDARSAFSATIRWADGYTSAGIIEPDEDKKGAYVVKSSHPLEDEGFYPGQVSVAGPHNHTVTVNFMIGVSTWSTTQLVLRVFAILALGASIALLLSRLAKSEESTPRRRAR